ncbi:response regulator transcription factor [Robbsia sp. Bb-Pol-6]|uniref:Response regulator transcription factor n=1 Tax=Robbsia betulipollinis TaxID=2981849 RepID=A0ABT3ZP89_9BURK|nr:response regulator transcription factor [Robbsia betulipollinis]MCY0387768.1 response regulator transcription factor [Robbsia betulipollinis]
MKSLLRQLDRRALTQEAHDWRQADHALRREPRDLVVADLAESDGQGSEREAAAALWSRHPDIVLAAICDELEAAMAVDLLHAGLRAVIPRELDWRSMIRALELVLLGGHYVPARALHLGAARPPASATRLHAAEHTLPYRRRLIDATGLSPRQQQIMRLVHMGSTNKGIARALGISEGTVKIHLATVFKMLGATNRAAAVAIYNGWLFDQARGLRTSIVTAPDAGAVVGQTAHSAPAANAGEWLAAEPCAAFPVAAAPPAPFLTTGSVTETEYPLEESDAKSPGTER